MPYVTLADPPNRLQRLRVERGLSQQQLADLVGVRREIVSRWENGHHKPTQRLVRRSLERVMGQPVAVLFSENESGGPQPAAS